MDMGLVLARHVAEAHGGRLTATCRPERGVVFTLCVPLADGGDGHDQTHEQL